MSENCKIAKIKAERDKAFIDIEVLTKDQQVVGKAEIMKGKTDKSFLWVGVLEVHPLCRRQGVGTEMMEAIADLAKDEKVDLVYVHPAQLAESGWDSYPVSEKALTAFYNKLGFKPCEAPKDVVTVTNEGLLKRGLCLTIKK